MIVSVLLKSIAKATTRLGALSPQEIDVPAPIVDMVYVKTGPVGEFCNVWKSAKEKAEGGAK